MFDKVIGVNLRGPFRLSVLAGTKMAEGRGGSIINITSTQSIKPRPHALPYAAAKAGLNAVTEGLAHAFGPTVRVNAILCGPFLTEVAEAWDMEEFEERAQRTMLCSAVDVPRRSSAPRSITPATRRASPLAPCCVSTVAMSEPAVSCGVGCRGSAGFGSIPRHETLPSAPVGF